MIRKELPWKWLIWGPLVCAVSTAGCAHDGLHPLKKDNGIGKPEPMKDQVSETESFHKPAWLGPRIPSQADVIP
jgi:hypothetical protein